MAMGLGLLRLEPRAFWSMTLPEFSAAARALLGPTQSLPDRPHRSELASLLARYPDAIQPVQQSGASA
jgi:uncharacterized phage protein (TIGR02216 family)